jgi:hypothetical protein
MEHSMTKKLAKEWTTDFTNVNVNALNFTNLEDSEKGQKRAFPRYEHPKYGSERPLYIQLPWILMESYGIPTLGQYYESDENRLFIKLPLNLSIPDIKNFVDFLKSIDSKLESKEFKEKIFGPKANKYKYQPIVKVPLDGDDEKKVRLPYMKLNLDTTYPDKKIKSLLFVASSTDKNRTRTQIDNLDTVSKFEKYLCYQSTIHPIIKPSKLWAHPPTKPGAEYGLTFKLTKVEVVMPQRSITNIKNYEEINGGFLDEDSDSDIDNNKLTPSNSDEHITETKVINTNKLSDKSDDESEDDSDTESSDDEPVQKPVLNVKAKAKAKK